VHQRSPFSGDITVLQEQQLPRCLASRQDAGRIPEEMCERVRDRRPIMHLPHSHGGLALIHLIGIDPATRNRSSGTDTGGGGMALEL